MRRRTSTPFALAAALLCAALTGACAPGPAGGTTTGPTASGTPTSGTPASGVTVVVDDALPRLPLSGLLPGAPGWPGQLNATAGGGGNPAGNPAVDHGIALGGIGSDLYPAAAPDEYWMITDRGPNGQIKLKGPNRRTFPVPGFDPLILRVSAAPGAPLRILQVIPLTTTDGRPVTGLSNDPARDEPPYDWTGNTALPTDPSGLDPEGLVRLPNGEFWVSEEYSPSILRVSPTGTVLSRFVPAGVTLPGAGYPVTDSLPAVFARRQGNRGFESLALAPDGTLYAALQSPASNPDADSGKTSHAVRVLAFDPAIGRPSAEYVYRMEDVAGFDPGAEGDQSQMKVSAMAWSGPDELIVDERTDGVTRLYRARLAGATNILGTALDDPAHNPSLEQADPGDGVTPLAKTLLVDVTGAVPNAPTKIEGVAVRDPGTIAVANDNDFGMRSGTDAFDANGQQRDTGTPSRLLVLHLGTR